MQRNGDLLLLKTAVQFLTFTEQNLFYLSVAQGLSLIELYMHGKGLRQVVTLLLFYSHKLVISSCEFSPPKNNDLNIY